MNPLDSFTVERLEQISVTKGFPSLNVVRDLAKIALAAKQAKPTAWRVGGYLSNDKSWAERASAEENYLLEPLYDHPLITGIDEDHHDPELEPGLYLAEIMTKGGAACINGKFTTSPAPQLPDGWVMVPKELTDDMAEAIAKEARCCGGIALDIYEATLAAAPKPE